MDGAPRAADSRSTMQLRIGVRCGRPIPRVLLASRAESAKGGASTPTVAVVPQFLESVLRLCQSVGLLVKQRLIFALQEEFQIPSQLIVN